MVKTCNNLVWGENCDIACGGGCPDNGGGRLCNAKTGVCTRLSDTCGEGWENSGELFLCDKPICFGKSGCSEQGTCIAPNYCTCKNGGAQVVGYRTSVKVGEPGKNAEFPSGIDCKSLRKDGLKGALVALIILLFAIGVCGTTERKQAKKGYKTPWWKLMPCAVGSFVILYLAICYLGFMNE